MLGLLTAFFLVRGDAEWYWWALFIVMVALDFLGQFALALNKQR